MPPFVVASAAAAATVPPPQSALDMQWVQTLPPKKALDSHTVCNRATGYCRAMAHYVFTAAPGDVTHPLQGGARFHFGDGKWAAGPPARFESHLVTGVCANYTDAASCSHGAPRQMWDWNYDATFLIADVDDAPEQVCAAPFLSNPYSAEAGSLPPVCLPLKPVQFVATPRRVGAFRPAFIYANLSEAATHYCSAAHCRTNVHIVALASVPDPTDEVQPVGSFSFDDGPWRTDSSATFFEEKMSLKQGGTWYQTFQWDFDQVSPKDAPAPKRVCFRLDLSDRVSMETVPFNFTQFGTAESGYTVRCLDFCTQHLAPFHSPAGYCGAAR